MNQGNNIVKGQIVFLPFSRIKTKLFSTAEHELGTAQPQLFIFIFINPTRSDPLENVKEGGLVDMKTEVYINSIYCLFNEPLLGDNLSCSRSYQNLLI